MTNTNTRVIDLTVGELEILIGRKVKESFPSIISQSQTQEKETEFIEVDAAATLLHMARQTVYSKCSKGILPYIKRGRKLLFERKQLLQFMQEGRKETISEAEEKINENILGRKLKTKK